MRSEDMTLTEVTVRVETLPRTGADSNTLADFYAKAHRRHQFETFRRDGQVTFSMETEGVKRFDAGRDWVRYHEAVLSDFEAIKSNAVDILAQYQANFDIAALADPSVQLRAVWNPEADRVSFSKFLGRLLEVDTAHSALLNATGGVAIGLHLTGSHEGAPRHDWTLMIEPSKNEPGNVILDLTAAYTSEVGDPARIGEYMQQRYDFFFDNVVRFLNSFLVEDDDVVS